MNVYRILGDCVGTSEARVLAERLVAWHDSMVKHLLRFHGQGSRTTTVRLADERAEMHA